MGAVLSSALVKSVLKATRNYGQQKTMIAPPGAAAADWPGLPEDLLLSVMASLDLPNLISSAAVCASWRDACGIFRLPELKQAPCLLYTCEQYGSSHAALYCPSTDTTFRVPFPGPPHEKRGFVFSCHGWVFAADEFGNPYLLNPMTGVQAALPPLKTITDCETYNDAGEQVYKDIEGGVPTTRAYPARHYEYHRVAIAPAAEMAACTVLIVHGSGLRLSFARPGNKSWTLIPDDKPLVTDVLVSDVLYNDKDGLFYVLYTRGSIYTLDLSEPSPPSMATFMDHVISSWMARMYLALTPSGELLQVWRMQQPVGRQDVTKHALRNRMKFANENGNDKLNLGRNHYEEDGLSEDDRVSTTEVLVFKVDIEKKRLLELRDIRNQALFLGFNAAVCLPTKHLSPFEPNSAYLTDDDNEYHHGMIRKDLCIWSIKKRSMQNLVDAWPNLHSWLDLPAPVWIIPRF